MCLCDDYASIPALAIGIEEVVDNDAKAKAFHNSFSPKMVDVDREPECAGSPLEEICWEPITDLEINSSINAAKGTTVPGEDGILTLVWKKLGTYL
jgi:hypothetical protein